MRGARPRRCWRRSSWSARGRACPQHRGPASRLGHGLGLSILLLCIAAGFIGSQNAYLNINMTLFWIVFVLGVPYAVAVCGDFFRAINPWRALVAACEDLAGMRFVGIAGGWHRGGRALALTFYIAFIWIELFAHAGPRGLSVALLAYSIANVAGAYIFGTQTWFEDGEFFGVMLDILGRMAPRRAAAPGAPARAPLVGLLDAPAANLGEVLFILFMLASTAFDGIHSTVPWVQVFWKNVFPVLAPWLGATPRQQFANSVDVYEAWQWAALVLMPFAYGLVYGAFLAISNVLTGSRIRLRELMLRFAPSLVPIAFVYHLTHYYTLLLAQAGRMVVLVSDPFGFGWNLFGTAKVDVRPWMVASSTLWHTQVALIVVGHVASVHLAHVEALRIFKTPRLAAISQLPMLALMMIFTAVGLWILSLPLAPSP